MQPHRGCSMIWPKNVLPAPPRLTKPQLVFCGSDAQGGVPSPLLSDNLRAGSPPTPEQGRVRVHSHTGGSVGRAGPWAGARLPPGSTRLPGPDHQAPGAVAEGEKERTSGAQTQREAARPGRGRRPGGRGTCFLQGKLTHVSLLRKAFDHILSAIEDISGQIGHNYLRDK